MGLPKSHPLEYLDCNTCVYQMVLNVHTSDRTDEIVQVLKDNNVLNVCTAFGDEFIANIGSFTESGCEMWEKRTPKQQKMREDSEKRTKERLFVP